MLVAGLTVSLLFAASARDADLLYQPTSTTISQIVPSVLIISRPPITIGLGGTTVHHAIGGDPVQLIAPLQSVPAGPIWRDPYVVRVDRAGALTSRFVNSSQRLLRSRTRLDDTQNDTQNQARCNGTKGCYSREDVISSGASGWP
ncbi:hypothetical protein BKA70DRAFT_1423862 [Coprinopsis sp. MPI-PUGE-AT-0042]|nr:hypothetical protein BKA70DRAFT_1423862 [Coprinopsis sp. MPI-PUGE-AT-0042]